MTYETFRNEVLQDLQHQEIGNVSLSLTKTLKSNGEMKHGVVFKSPSSNTSPTIYLEEFYEFYQATKDFDTVIDRLSDLYRSLPVIQVNEAELYDYSTAKSRIIMKLVNTEKNRTFLETVPHIPFQDLSIVYYYLIGKSDGILLDMPVRDVECHHCGACCRHVKDSVPLESLDVYRIVRFLQSQDKSFDSIEHLLSLYAEPVPIHECGYFIYTLKTVGADDSCIFLKDNRCTIQTAKPRACRTYPLVAEPDDASSFQYYLSMEKDHHFTGRKFKARNWMNQYFTQEDRAFVNADISAVSEIAQLLRQIPETHKHRALFCFLLYKYTDFDLDQPFQEQYEKNNQKLIASLKAMVP